MGFGCTTITAIQTLNVVILQGRIHVPVGLVMLVMEPLANFRLGCLPVVRLSIRKCL